MIAILIIIAYLIILKVLTIKNKYELSQFNNTNLIAIAMGFVFLMLILIGFKNNKIINTFIALFAIIITCAFIMFYMTENLTSAKTLMMLSLFILIVIAMLITVHFPRFYTLIVIFITSIIAYLTYEMYNVEKILILIAV